MEMNCLKDVCGGAEDFSNPKAAKAITSHELVGLSLAFNHSLQGRVMPASEAELGFPEGYYCYNIAQDEAGKFTLKKGQREYPMDERNLALLSSVMQRTNVAESNGKHRVTNGLPAGMPSYSFNAVFASGETIEATECPGFAGWLLPIAGFLESYMAGFKQYKPEPPKVLRWNCSCGQKGLTSKFCGNCGTASPINADGSWNCGCGQKNLRGKFCSECGSKAPIMEEEK